jgi:hypothetical protein
MLDRLRSLSPKIINDLVSEANEIVGYDLGKIIDTGPSVGIVLHMSICYLLECFKHHQYYSTCSIISIDCILANIS